MIRDNSAVHKITSILSFIVIFTLCSTTSPLYAFCEESHCFFTVGKAIYNGKVLYKDILEQKGLLIYAIQIPGYLISNTTFLGVWILQSILMAISGLLVYKIFREMRYTEKASSTGALLCSIIVFTSPSIASGQVVEVYLLPAFLFSIFCVLHYIENDYSIPGMIWIMNGLVAGVAFWMKYSLCGFWIGLAAAFVFCRVIKKDYRAIAKQIIFSGLGVIIVFVPCLLYFYRNQAVSELIRYYFSNNISSYGAGIDVAGTASGYVKAFFIHMKTSPVLVIVILAGMIWIIRSSFKMETKAVLISGFLIMYLTVFVHGGMFRYYLFAFAGFSIFGVSAILTIVGKIPVNQKIKRLAFNTPVIFTLGIAITLVLLPSPNQFLKSRKDLVQTRFAQYMNSRYESPTMLDYMYLDGGFYTAANIVPNTWAFCGLNWDNPEMLEDQLNSIREKKVDFVVVREETKSGKNKKLPQELIDNYEMTDSMTQQRVNTLYTYSLFEVRD